MHSKNCHLLSIDIIASDITLIAVEDETIGAIPVLDDLQTIEDFTTQLNVMQVSAQENRFDGASEFREGSVSGMMNVMARKAFEDSFGLSYSKAQSSGIFLVLTDSVVWAKKEA